MLEPSFVVKYPGEIVDLDIDLSPTVPEGSAISSVSVMVVDSNDYDMTSQMISSYSYADNKLKVVLKNGLKERGYTLWAIVDYNDGQRIFHDLAIRVLKGP